MSTRVLVIEDNDANLDLITYLLEAFGYSVSVARNGRDGLAAARSVRPDLILCDVQMPDMDGMEVVAHLKRDPELAAIWTIAMTAYAMVGDRERLLAAGFDAYIAKPIQPDTFVDQLQQPGSRSTGARMLPQFADAADVTKAASERTLHQPLLGMVLLVDDTVENGALIQTLLEPAGYRVLLAHSTAKGEKLALKHRPQLILSDIHIGGENGFDFIMRLKTHRVLDGIPFAFMSSTGMNVAEDRRRSEELGACAFIQRPIDGEDFVRRVQACLAREH